MTRDEAVKKHRAMWRWIAEQIESQKKRLCIPRLKDIYCQVNRDKIFLNCYCCEYASMKIKGCKDCPIASPGWDCASGGLYTQVVDETNWKVQARIARRIAELPERDEE